MDTDVRIREWLRKQRDDLINMSRANRLLSFRHTKTASLEIADPGAEKVLARLEHGGRTGEWGFHLPPPEDEETDDRPEPKPNELVIADKDAAQLERALHLLERKANQEFVDKGLWVLYLGLGMLEWRESPADDKTMASPLLLLPVTIARDTLREPFRLRRTEDDPVVNPALVIKLEGEFDLVLPTAEEFEEKGFGETLREVEELVEGHSGWSVTRRVVLSTFTFQKEAMYRDLLDNEDELAANPMVGVLALGTEAPSAGSFDFDPVPEEQLDRRAPPEDLVSVLDADATQRRAIIAAREGHSFVMDGPPGSGKSQTITNIIAELLRAGKSVLFVSEKAAALDVVHNRLAQANLAEFALQLHSHSATRRAVASELGRALNHWPVAHGALSPSERADLVRRRAALTAYAQAMNEIRQPLGRSLHQVLGTVAELQSLPQAPVPTGFGTSLRPESLSAVLEAAVALGHAWGPVERGDDFLWRDLIDPTVSASRRSEVERDLATATNALDALRGLAATIDGDLGLGWDGGTQDAWRLRGLLALLEERWEIPRSWLSAESLDPVRQRCAELSERTRQYHAVRAKLRENVGEHHHELRLDHAGRLEEATAVLRSAQPPLLPGSDATAETLTKVARFLRDSPDRLAGIAEDARRVAAGFGLTDRDITPGRAAELAELGGLVDSPAKPETRWLAPTAQATLGEAVRVLGELHHDFHTRREELRGVFTDDVLNLDLRSLHVRFTDVHRGVRKLGPAYREDKRALAACTVSGRADRRARDRLADAVAWKEVAERLATAESRHAGILGDHYYRHADTDFERINAAVEVAQRALDLAGEEAGGEEFVRQLAREGSPDPGVLQAARRLGANVATWLEDARRFTGAAESLRATPIDRVAPWCVQIAGAVLLLSDATDHVSHVAGGPVSLGFARKALNDAAEAARLRKTVEEGRTDDAELGERFQGVDTDWAAMEGALTWAGQLRDALGGPVHQHVAEALLTTTFASDDLNDRLSAWDKAVGRITAQFTGQRAQEVGADLTGDFDLARLLLDKLAETVGDIDEWAAHSRERAWLERHGLEPVVSFCAERRVGANQVRKVVERAVLEAWADDVLRSDADRLGALRAADRDTLAEEFRKLDERLVKSAAAHVVNACSNRRPTSTAGVAGIIQREAQKKKRHMPIRELLGKAGEVAQRLKPCFMMSPLSVSQYLPASLRFDVVIFDEASQVRPCDAVNCVYRGHQLIVAGDQKQLPPTSFFSSLGTADDESYDEDQIDDFESVLDLCKGAGALRSLPLRWHYRSRHESLITYSNYSFYGGGLLTFPGAEYEAPDLGIELFKVDGVYRRSGARDNPVEARKVVDRVLHHRRHHPTLTLGVVTFSAPQEDAIQRELERRAAEYPELANLRTDDRIDGFFIKNLENVQGDERDIILFSVGYGPDEHGRFTLQIPHLARPGSERRLNVAITRAKRRVEVVTSVYAGDFPGNPTSGGLWHLRRYLDYAERGTPALAIEAETPDAMPESPFEEEVIRSIQAWGYEARPQVGVAGYRIDIGVRHPERPGTYALAVECDGAMYHSAKTARDRDRLRQQVLEGLGWRIHRIWGTAWYRDRAGQEARLRAAIEEAVAGPETQPDPAAPAEGEVRIWDREAELDAAPEWTEPYRAADLSPPMSPYELHEPEARGELGGLVEEAVRQEGPVHEERVLRAVREAWGVGRAGRRIQEAFDSVIRQLERHGVVRREERRFLSASSTALQTVRVPTDDPNTRREARHIPPRELRLAVLGITGDAHAITREEVSVSVARLFGWQRRGPEVRAALDDAVSALVTAGELAEVDGYLRLPSR